MDLNISAKTIKLKKKKQYLNDFGVNKDTENIGYREY